MDHVTGSTGGYNVEFDPPLETKHECPLCSLALREPYQTACGHRFCASCIKTRLKNKQRLKCPIDTEIISADEIFPDNFCRREVLSLRVKCKNCSKGEEDGCPWKGPLNQYNAHLERCDFQKQSCPNKGCGLVLNQRDLAKHVSDECEFRLESCDLCGQEIIVKALEKHKDSECLEAMISCPNECGETVKRKDLAFHQTKECSRAHLQCKYDECSYEGTSEEMEEHYKEKADYHIFLIYQQLQTHPAAKAIEGPSSFATPSPTTASSSLTPTVAPRGGLVSFPTTTSETETNIKEQMSTLEEDISEKNRQIEVLQSTVDHLKKANQTKEELLQRQSNDIEKLKRDLSTSLARLSALEQKQVVNQTKSMSNEHKILLFERGTKVREDVLAEHDVRLVSLELASYDGILRWKITDFNKRRSEAIAGKRLSIYSPPFYTAPTGYRMCARIYLNGDGIGKSSHLSLFFVVMRGDYDALLLWPFQQRVTFTLLDQQPANKPRVDVSDSFIPDSTSNSFRRPVSEMNIASGCPLFFPLADLGKRAYVLDDTMFIRVSVHIAGLSHP